MWDDDKDKELMRNQLLAIVLMGVLMFVWFTFFMPSEPPVQRQAEDGAAEQVVNTARENDPESSTSRESTPGTSPAPVIDDGAIGIPAAEPAENPESDEVTLTNEHLGLTFTRVGARLKRAFVFTDDGDDEGTVQLVPDGPEGGDTLAVYPLGLRFSDAEIGDAFDYARFDVESASDDEIVFRLDLPAATMRKRFYLADREHVVGLEISYTAKDAGVQFGSEQSPAYRVVYGPGMLTEGEGRYFKPELIWRQGETTEKTQPKDLPRDDSGVPRLRRVPEASWIGYHSIYFLTAMHVPDAESALDGGIIGDEARFNYGLSVPAFGLQPGQTHTAAFECYIGPMHMSSLRDAWPGLSSALRFFGPGNWFIVPASFVDLMDWFAKLLLRNLNWWYSFIPNYGVAIILLTIVVRMVMFPLTLKQIRTGKRMRELQPEMKAIQEKYKDNREELGKAMMSLYKERKINPLSGCFPLLLQMPVFIALYRMIWKSYELRGADFLWIKDLSQGDRLFAMPFMADIPVIGPSLEYFHLLPFLVTGTMILSMRMMPQSPASTPEQEAVQKMMMRIMPIMFGVFSWQFSAGLNLYVFTSTLLGVAQNQLVRSSNAGGAPVSVPAVVGGSDAETSATAPVKTSGKSSAKTAGAPKTKKKEAKDPKQRLQEMKKKRKQHFYDRVQQQKKEQARAARRNKKR